MAVKRRAQIWHHLYLIGHRGESECNCSLFNSFFLVTVMTNLQNDQSSEMTVSLPLAEQECFIPTSQ